MCVPSACLPRLTTLHHHRSMPHFDSSPPAGAFPVASSTAGMLTPADVREFQGLVREHCGVCLTETEAWHRATELVALYRMFLGPFPEDPAIPAQH